MDISGEIIIRLIESGAQTRSDLRKIMAEVYAKHKIKGYQKTVDIRDKYNQMLVTKEIKRFPRIEELLVTKRMRSISGVSVITVLTKPWPCPGKCIYCPTEKGVPQSYLSNEPAVMRAILNEYDAASQVKTRLESLTLQGHPTDKVEIIVIGGTFSAHPRKYQETFIKGVFDALNGRKSKDLSEAQKLNEKAKHRCVGLTLETRPDTITEEEVMHFRKLGATRIELGVQTIYDEILSKNDRGHGSVATIGATKLLKDAGFKICYHLMPNLYGSTYAKDIKMFAEIFGDPHYKPDYIKIYPTVVTEGTKLYELWKKGEYKNYSDKKLEDLICAVKKEVPYWVRIMRTIRDIPAESIISGSKVSNMRQIVLERLKSEKTPCKCIRCREVGLLDNHKGDPKSQVSNLFTEEYVASDGREFFLSYESKDRKILYSLLRLRLTHAQYISEIKNCALIREVHTYGQEVGVGKLGKTQHVGYGKRLIAEAEKIAKKEGYNKIAVIAGIGVRDYYRKLGYKLAGTYMIKNL